MLISKFPQVRGECRLVFFLIFGFFLFCKVCLAGITQEELESEIRYINDESQSIYEKVVDKQFEDAQAQINSLIEHLREKLQSSFFYWGVLDVKRSVGSNYTPPSIKPLQEQLIPEYYMNYQGKIRLKYHQVRLYLEQAEHDLAVKKYKAVLTVLIAAFTTCKDIVDIIQTSLDPDDLPQLPKKLADMVDKAKKDAETISKHLDSIKAAAEKVRLINQSKGCLVKIMHYIREIQNFVSAERLSLSKLSRLLSKCTKELNAAAAVQIRQESPTSFDSAKYEDSLNKLLSDFRNGKISKDEYIRARDEVIKEAKQEFNSIPNPSSTTVEQYNEFCRSYCEYVTDEGMVFDSQDLENYKQIKAQVDAYKQQWRDALVDLINTLQKTDFFMQDREKFGKPIGLKPVDISTEWNYLHDNWQEYGLFEEGYVWNDIQTLAEDQGPSVLSEEYQMWGNDPSILSSRDWILELAGYLDRLKQRAGIYYRVAITSIRSQPRENFSNFVYAELLLDRSKILDLRNNIREIYFEIGKFPDDWLDMANECFDSESEIRKKLDELSSAYANLIGLKGHQYLTEDDFHLSLSWWDWSYNCEGGVCHRPWKAAAFFGGKWEMNLEDTPYFLNIAEETIDYLMSFQDTVRERAATYQEIVDDYFRKINEVIEFDDKLLGGELKAIIDALNDLAPQLYRWKLGRLWDRIKAFEMDIKLNDILSGDYLSLKDAYEDFNKTYSGDKREVLSRLLKRLKGYMDLIKDGTESQNPESLLFMGQVRILKDGRGVMEQIASVCWPEPSDDSSTGVRHHIYVEYLNPDQISLGIPKVENLLSNYNYSPPTPTNFKIVSTSGDEQRARPNMRLPKKIRLVVKDINSGAPASHVFVCFHFWVNYTPGSKIDPVRRDQKILSGEYRKFYTMTDSNGVAEVWWTVGEDQGTVKSWGLKAEVQSDQGSDEHAFVAYNLNFRPDEDTDQDGIPDQWEYNHAIDGEPLNGELLNCDFDGDGLSSEDEYLLGTDPLQADTDGDGMPDGWERDQGLDPQGGYDAKLDYDGDGLLNKEEAQMGFDTNDINSPSGGVAWPKIEITENGAKVAIFLRNLVPLTQLVLRLGFPPQLLRVGSIVDTVAGLSYTVDNQTGEVGFSWSGDMKMGERRICTVNFASVGSVRLQGEGSYSIRIEPVEVVGTDGEIEEPFVGASREIGFTILATLKGDVDGNKKLDLTDAILALQVVSEMKPQGIRPYYPLSGIDVNGDDRIGIEEAIYVLQKVSGLR